MNVGELSGISQEVMLRRKVKDLSVVFKQVVGGNLCTSNVFSLKLNPASEQCIKHHFFTIIGIFFPKFRQYNMR